MTDRDPLTLELQLCFALYSASRALTNRYRPLLDELGLTYPQYLVLIALYQHGSMSVKDLGTALHLDSGTLSPLLKRMESAGLLRRTRSASDERSVLIELTDAGLALRPKVAEVPLEVYRSLGTHEDLAELHSRLTAFNARF